MVVWSSVPLGLGLLVPMLCTVCLVGSIGLRIVQLFSHTKYFLEDATPSTASTYSVSVALPNNYHEHDI